MKESKLLEMQNKIQSLTNVISFLMQENDSLRTLSVGTLETVKLMPGYDKAIEELKTKLKDGQEEKMEVPATEDAQVY